MSMSTETTNAVAYIRVSTDEQNLGPKAQRRDIERYARAHGIEIVAWCEDHGVSGGASFDKRPALIEALATAKIEGATLIIAAKRDRFARDVAVMVAIEQAAKQVGAQLVTPEADGGDDPSSKLLRGVLDLIAAFERDMIKARTRGALQVKKNRGERVGAIPYGKRLAADGVHLKDDEDEQLVIAAVLEYRNAGLSYRAIASRLEVSGKFTRTGKRFAPTQIARIIKGAA